MLQIWQDHVSHAPYTVILHKNKSQTTKSLEDRDRNGQISPHNGLKGPRARLKQGH